VRLSEKTLELNICAQVSTHLKGCQNVFWFGLTQKQEAKAGFDACTKLGGRLFIFQFKASNNVLKNNSRRKFLTPHYQLDALRKSARNSMRSVFYALPNIGNTTEMYRNPDLLSQTWLLDVAALSHLGLPTKADGTMRKNGCHNMYLEPGQVEIHSDAIIAPLINAQEFVSQGFPGADGFQWVFKNNSNQFLEFCSLLSQGSRGMVLY
tara:strand:- start:275 stop:898 length:624 start_codon:yes stop_codon:yes gene_type:complete